MKQHLKPILILMLIATVFTELLTSNIPLSAFIDPRIFLFLIILAYGLPTLLIREISVRNNLGILSIFLLGLAYGIWNEGILAKTILLNSSVPIDYFDGYASLLGINFAWAGQIMIWHAFMAVLFPIMLTHYFFKADRARPWLSKRAAVIIGTIITALGLLVFFLESENGISGDPAQLAVFAGVMVALYLLALKFKDSLQLSNEQPKNTRRLLLIGFSFTFLLFVAVGGVLAGIGAPTIAFFIGFSLLVYVLYRAIRKVGGINEKSLITVALGAYIGQGIFTMIFMSAPTIIVTNSILILILVIFVRKYKALHNPPTEPQN